jgi:hypothetical protein
VLHGGVVYINTPMIQHGRAAPAWQGRLTRADRWGVTPLVGQQVNPYGTFTLNMHERLPLKQTAYGGGMDLVAASLG